ncbi:MAG: family 43 glycosylhydrolase [Clostridiales bacterium]|nr:family 43 glycosylhydrolase [Clostridiales bacterium]
MEHKVPQNPLIPIQDQLFIADGEPHVFNGKMYVYGSRDLIDSVESDGSFDFCSKSYHVIYSDDLLVWHDGGESIRLSDIPKELREGEPTRLWAPDAFQCPVCGKYFLTFCTNRQRCYIAESDSPTGPFSNVKIITLNGNPITNIDPGVLADDDGKVYIVGPNFWIGQLDPEDYSKILPGTFTDVRKYMPMDNEPFEGPSLRKRDNKYYYIYIQNNGKIKDEVAPVRMAYMTADAPLGPYEYGGIIVNTYEYPGSANVHGSIEKWKGEWYVFYHMPVADLELTRTMFADKIMFNQDGSINQLLPTSSGVRGPFKKNDEVPSSCAVIFSKGRKGRRVHLDKYKYGEKYEIKDYPYVFFYEVGEWIGFRYWDLTGIESFTIRFSAEGRVKLILRSEAELLAEFNITGTNGEIKTLTQKIKKVSTEKICTLFAEICEISSDGQLVLYSIKG